jgi:hypothetical protein
MGEYEVHNGAAQGKGSFVHGRSGGVTNEGYESLSFFGCGGFWLVLNRALSFF